MCSRICLIVVFLKSLWFHKQIYYMFFVAYSFSRDNTMEIAIFKF